MKMQKIFFTLLFVTAMSIALTNAYAQNTDARAWKQRLAEQISAGQRGQVDAKTETAKAQTADTENVSVASERQLEDNSDNESPRNRLRDFVAEQKNAIVGTWDLTLTFGDGSKVKSTLSVLPGRKDGEGSVLHAAEASLLLPNPTTPEQGVWQHRGGLRFVLSYQGYAVDEKFEKPVGKIGFRHALRLSADQETFLGEAIFEVRDTEGNVVFSDHIQTRGERQHAVAP